MCRFQNTTRFDSVDNLENLWRSDGIDRFLAKPEFEFLFEWIGGVHQDQCNPPIASLLDNADRVLLSMKRPDTRPAIVFSLCRQTDISSATIFGLSATPPSKDLHRQIVFGFWLSVWRS